MQTSQYSLKAHEKMFTQPCIGNPKLANGLVNTEETAYQLQLAFGCVAFRRELERVQPGEVPPITGKIIMLCADGAKSYAVNPLFLHPKYFSLASVDRAPPRPAAKAKGRQASDLASLPVAEAPKHIILAKVRKHIPGAIFAEKPGDYGSFCVSTNDGKDCVVVGLYHDPLHGKQKSSRFKASREKIIEDVFHLRQETKSYTKITGALLTFSEGKYKFHKLRIPKQK